jgi:hypothetical protein
VTPNTVQVMLTYRIFEDDGSIMQEHSVEVTSTGSANLFDRAQVIVTDLINHNGGN